MNYLIHQILMGLYSFGHWYVGWGNILFWCGASPLFYLSARKIGFQLAFLLLICTASLLGITALGSIIFIHP